MNDPARILVIQLRQLGDILMCTPLLRRLKMRHPQARIDVLCEGIGRQLLEHNPYVQRLIHLPRKAGAGVFWKCLRELRRESYDWIIDAQSLPKTALLAKLSAAPRRSGFGKGRILDKLYTEPYLRQRADYSALDKLRLVGEEATSPAEMSAQFFVSPESTEQAKDFVAQYFDQRPVAALFGVSRRAYKVWPVEHLAELASRFHGAGYLPFLVYGPGEKEQAAEISAQIQGDCLFDYTMPDFATLKEILAHCALFAGNDGGPKHLAQIAGIPAVAVFGHVHPEAWTLPGDPGQRFVATASNSRKIPTAGPCLDVDQLHAIPAAAVWHVIEEWSAGGLIPALSGESQ